MVGTPLSSQSNVLLAIIRHSPGPNTPLPEEGGGLQEGALVPADPRWTAHSWLLPPGAQVTINLHEGSSGQPSPQLPQKNGGLRRFNQRDVKKQRLKSEEKKKERHAMRHVAEIVI